MDGFNTKSGDVYSFGCILWELFMGRRAWGNATLARVIFEVTVNFHTLKLSNNNVNSRVPEEYLALQNACVSFDKNKRPIFKDIVAQVKAMLETTAVDAAV